MIKGSIKQIETMGLVDGPGIRTVIFMNGCSLRCIFCHNPEMWLKQEDNYTPEDILNIIIKYKNYFKDNGGVTFSGGEPLLQPLFLIECLRLCKNNNIHTCLDTAGVGDPAYFEEILKYTDLVIYDIKALNQDNYLKITGSNIDNSLLFLEACQKNNNKLWIRQVIMPSINDNLDYINKLSEYIKTIKNVLKVELLPYHKIGLLKYDKLGIINPIKEMLPMDVNKCSELEEILIKNIKTE
ncbi:MAG: pyruvate formate-lyase-activating protein [Bacilli bacterium]|nr:pyruvate formate-lyase-activating protein [Bacilli bacterium]